MELSDAQLEKLGAALKDLGARGGGRVPPHVVRNLSESLPDGVGMTVDFEAAKALGHPLVVLRPSRCTPDCFLELSPRELEVTGLVASGLRNSDIAVALGIRLGTVKDHVHRILTKSGLDSRAAVAAEWARGQPR